MMSWKGRENGFVQESCMWSVFGDITGYQRLPSIILEENLLILRGVMIR